MIEKSTLQFLSQIKKNNNKPWFEKNRSKYELAKANLTNFSEQMIKGISTFDPSVSAVVPKDTLFRFYRDVRFSKNKSPYKTNMAVYINRDGKKADSPGYYIHIEPGNSFMATGIWMPEPDTLASIRQEIDYNFPAWKKIITARSFRSGFPDGLSQEDKLTRPPKGYEKDNPAIDFLLLKSFIVTRTLTNDELTNRSSAKFISKQFSGSKPFIDFLRVAISE